MSKKKKVTRGNPAKRAQAEQTKDLTEMLKDFKRVGEFASDPLVLVDIWTKFTFPLFQSQLRRRATPDTMYATAEVVLAYIKQPAFPVEMLFSVREYLHDSKSPIFKEDREQLHKALNIRWSCELYTEQMISDEWSQITVKMIMAGVRRAQAPDEINALWLIFEHHHLEKESTATEKELEALFEAFETHEESSPELISKVMIKNVLIMGNS